jgi:hypothetical protein
MTDLLHQPGFFGTAANFAADMTLALSILMAVVLTLGFYFAVRKKHNLHKWFQTGGVLLNVVLVLWLMILPYREFIIRDTGGPRESIFYAITAAHAAIGALAFFFGIFVVLRGHNMVPKALRFSHYKLFMRTAYGLYMITTLLGVWTYVTWFVTTAKPPQF